MENSGSVILVFVLIIAALGATFYIRNLLTKRAALKVIKIFYEQNALGMEGAKTPQELGLQRLDFLQRMVKPRDYKQYALQVLIKNGVVHVTADGKFYMLEQRLDPKYRLKRNS